MPNIREYRSPIDTIHPDEKGYQAREMAGRRVGPLYNQMGQDLKEGGRIQAQLIDEQGKGDADLAKQAQQLNTDALDYLGLLHQQRQSTPRAPSGGAVGGGNDVPLGRYSYNMDPYTPAGPDPLEVSEAAARTTSAAKDLVSDQYPTKKETWEEAKKRGDPWYEEAGGTKILHLGGGVRPWSGDLPNQEYGSPIGPNPLTIPAPGSTMNPDGTIPPGTQMVKNPYAGDFYTPWPSAAPQGTDTSSSSGVLNTLENYAKAAYNWAAQDWTQGINMTQGE